MVHGPEVDRVRRFNRAITQRVGALNDSYLARDRPLGEARVLWEIGGDGCDVRALRSRLELDSGYLSRLLRSLEGDGLVTVESTPKDRRVRVARLTKQGRREWAILDERSDALAQSLLDPLTSDQRERLVVAMGEVERLLTAALVRVEVVDPDHRHVQHCLEEYAAELGRRVEGGFDPSRSRAVDSEDFRPPVGAFLLATLRDETIGCAGVRRYEEGIAEVKRMWVAPAARGLGVGRRLLAEVEGRAAALGAHRVRLDTNKTLTEAVAMYRASGYQEIPAYNDEPYADHWFEKDLPVEIRQDRAGSPRKRSRRASA